MQTPNPIMEVKCGNCSAWRVGLSCEGTPTWCNRHGGRREAREWCDDFTPSKNAPLWAFREWKGQQEKEAANGNA